MSSGVDRELLAVQVALEPLDDRTDVAASLWNTGNVDLGYIACALGGRPLQAVLDATAVRAGHEPPAT